MDSGFAADAAPRNDDLRGKISREWRLAQDHVRCLLRDHEHASVDVGGDEIGHDGGINHTQALGAAHAQLRIGDRFGADPHRAGSTWMMRGDRSLSDEGIDVGVRLHLRPG